MFNRAVYYDHLLPLFEAKRCLTGFLQPRIDDYEARLKKSFITRLYERV